MKIILADDHALFRDGFVLLLRQHEPEAACLVAGDFDAGLALLAGHADADLLLLDLNMPGMRGEDSLRTVQARHPGLPVSILSGDMAREQVEALVAAGASGYIPKSASAQEMITAVRLMIAGGVYVPPEMMASRPAAPDTPLTARQMDILRLLATGKPNKLICRELNLSEGTVKTHVNAIYRILGVDNRTEAALKARRLGLAD